MLRTQLTRPVRYEPVRRFWFAALSRLIRRLRWREIFLITPGTMLGRHRPFVAWNWDYAGRRHHLAGDRQGRHRLHSGAQRAGVSLLKDGKIRTVEPTATSGEGD